MSGIEVEEGSRRSAGESRRSQRENSWCRAEHVVTHHDSGLLAIGLFKLVEAVFFLLVGVGAIHFIHRDLGDAALRLARGCGSIRMGGWCRGCWTIWMRSLRNG